MIAHAIGTFEAVDSQYGPDTLPMPRPVDCLRIVTDRPAPWRGHRRGQPAGVKGAARWRHTTLDFVQLLSCSAYAGRARRLDGPAHGNRRRRRTRPSQRKVIRPGHNRAHTTAPDDRVDAA
jgi:hypothetical protein